MGLRGNCVGCVLFNPIHASSVSVITGCCCITVCQLFNCCSSLIIDYGRRSPIVLGTVLIIALVLVQVGLHQGQHFFCEAINNNCYTTLTDKIISNKVLALWHARNNNYTCLTTNGFHHHFFTLNT